ncbi:MAG: SPASM domain-containing protein [Dehalococcoidia bacterium]|nr:SPASM domain-containing protein [Dehalococcoidia bacterium]
MDDKPRKLNIEVTTRCNLNCAMCMRKLWKEDGSDMTMETYRALLPIFPEIEAVNIIGIGEPLLNENVIEMIRLGKEHLPPNGAFSLTTNATLLDDTMAKQLVSSGLDDIVVSIDGATSGTYNEIRKDASLDQVLTNVERLNKAKKKLGIQTPRIGFEFVAMKRNISELPQVVDLAARYSISFIIITHLLPHTSEMNDQTLYEYDSDQAIELFNATEAEAKRRNLDMAFETPDVENYANALFGVPPLKDKLRSANPVRDNVRGYDESMEQKFQLLDETVAKAREQKVLMNFKSLMQRDGTSLDHTARIFAEASAKAEEHSIALDLPPLTPKTERECGFIKNRIAFVSWDGYVRPCNNLYHSYMCYVNNREKSITSVSFGNVRERDFSDIWNSREYRTFRKRVDRFDFSPCGDCPHAEACFALLAPVFRKDCYEYTLPCGDCPWARGILKCM